MRLILACLALVVMLAPPALAAPRPFELRDGQVVITVTINGKELPALLDTGATKSLIETDLAKELGIRVQKFNGGTVGAGGGSIGYGMTDRKVAIDFGLGPVSRRLGIYEPRHAFAADGVRLLIGMDLLHALVVSLDFQEMTVAFQPSAGFTPPLGEPLKLTEAGWLRNTLTVNLAGAKAKLLLDTAASSALHLDSSFVGETQALSALPASSRRIVGIDGARDQAAIVVPQVTFGGLTFENVGASSGSFANLEIGNTNIDGIAGVDLLKRFDVVIDFGYRRVWMTPISAAHS